MSESNQFCPVFFRIKSRTHLKSIYSQLMTVNLSLAVDAIQLENKNTLQHSHNEDSSCCCTAVALYVIDVSCLDGEQVKQSKRMQHVQRLL